jgi:SAM-dependent methyltransferase
MKLYERGLIESIERFLGYDQFKRETAYALIKKGVADIIEKLREQYQRVGIREELVKARVQNVIENNFERIFILDPGASGEDIKLLARIIKRQRSGNASIRVVSISMNETSTSERPQDFGVVLTSKGDLFGMFCDVDRLGNPIGGRLITNREEISTYVDCYLKIRGKSEEIALNYSEEDITRILGRVQKENVDISHREVYGNRCYMCLQRAEQMVNSDQWANEHSALRTWFDIVHEEHEELTKLLVDTQPRDVLEIGCGAGRVPNLIMRLVSEGKLSRPSRVVGYEQNPEISNYCRYDLSRHAPLVTIQTQFVGVRSDGQYSGLLPKDRNFDLIVAISNLVGWQGENEAKWLTNVMKDGLKSGGRLFFTVYKRGFELERARMYKAAGDLIEVNSGGSSGTRDITILADAFGNEKHKSKAYGKPEIEMILRKVRDSGIAIDKVDIKNVGKYMWGISLVRV